VIQAGSTQLVFVQKDILGGPGNPKDAGQASRGAAPKATPKFLKSSEPKRRRRR
jgi:hypothetical protein